MKNLYIGPVDIWHRFKAGLSVTADNFAADDSLWVVEKTTRYDLERAAPVFHGVTDTTEDK